jgi:hypothetical protein
MPLHRTAAALAAAGILSLSGCITLYSKTDVVRSGENRTAVAFETPETAEKFQAALKKMHNVTASTYVGVPFVTLYEREQHLADAAMWNDAVKRCDTNQDGVITAAEVEVFAKAVAR